MLKVVDLLINSTSRNFRRFVLVILDVAALILALYSAYALRLSEWWPSQYLESAVPLFLTVPFVGVFVFIRLGLYRAVLRYLGLKALKTVAIGTAILVVLVYALAQLFFISNFPRSIPIIFGLVAWLYLGGSRLIFRNYYHWIVAKYHQTPSAIIYGAGSAGSQLALMLPNGGEYKPVAFVDDNPSLWNGYVGNLKVHSPDTLKKLIDEFDVELVLLALPSASSVEIQQVMDRLSVQPVRVKTMPSIKEILSGRAADQLRDMNVDDLLGRDVVPPIDELIDASLKGNNVCITGAGGSIGSELARQAANNGAALVVLYELSELALYEIDRELRLSHPDLSVIPLLGSVLDFNRLKASLEKYQINTLYHAAAYKHVPIVEHNILQGLRNNVLGTESAARAAIEAKVERFVLISTDKAVRPTNVMGATKRLAELYVQHLAVNQNNTIMCMVRFGNVLGSSGSVVPLFKRQIESGGPVTVTHPEITRYFMTIPEAALLVVQAGSLAKGGDVFLLDMGEPVKIINLAKNVIKLSGHSIQDDENPEGEIAISYSGLRPGEKLFEELLIGDNPSSTVHPKIMTAHEDVLSGKVLNSILLRIKQVDEANDSASAREILIEAVNGFVPNSPNVDLLR
ncbi:nucleoside-diphosphate sugar epimerase/dehydratase [Marinobacterium sp. xm-d-564]|uniref:polysaccharide biosynthesis protein n=1 Tax=Marinobacterium sp. xm-d-564 TaxID=2497742 RepID=UPI001568AD0B|nr:nucleoside-diphosphate sugar epimerase/dehydratase [Marinobacterium sp. xm-d-564]NRP58444.1 UDP-N-acetyl-alpha-D-glucosamine C6 dehydratase [Marinobacterium sp. xm-d-564]